MTLCSLLRCEYPVEPGSERCFRHQDVGRGEQEDPFDAERFVERAGFAACMTDARRPGPSLYVAVCGRRDAIMPRNVQKDPEASHTWHLKDDLVKAEKVGDQRKIKAAQEALDARQAWLDQIQRSASELS